MLAQSLRLATASRAVSSLTTAAGATCSSGSATTAPARESGVGESVVGFASSSSVSDEKPPFTKILVANRGEIACRVMRTCRQMGIGTVAVYSDADKHALHVRLADEAINVGPAPSAESYLMVDRIVEACKSTGAQAVHPGYGFLSENQTFAAALADEGIAFIGPGSFSISAMGDKIESKRLANEAKVNTIPGFAGVIDDPNEAVRIARDEVGYPVMIKASAGGGGKGMRIAWNDEEALEGFRLAKSEAASSFGDDRLFVEKYIDEPRHIEFQVLADSFGNTIYLPERECSVQRRNQKVVEEAPSTFLDEKTRKAMGEQAVQMAKAVNYQSAGTVEFLVDSQKNFYFLEMNTRLQVEHPITEAITGIDLVEQMIRVAAGQKLSLKQSDIGIHGWATESRVYAEDPLRGFLPSIGTLNKYIEPVDVPGVPQESIRADSGIVEGSEISMYYDPMICKLVTHAETRDECLDRMEAALDSYVIRGVKHNINILRDIINHPRYRSGNYTTKFIEEEYPEGYQGHVLTDTEKHDLHAIAGVIQAAREERDATVADEYSTFAQASGQAVREYVIDGTPVSVGPAVDLSSDYTVMVGDAEPVSVSSDWAVESPIWHGSVGENKYITQVVGKTSLSLGLVFAGTEVSLPLLTPKQAEYSKYMPVKAAIDHSKVIMSPMPGKIVSINVKPGDEVVPGMEVAVIEAMKMQNVLRAEGPATVKAVNVGVGDDLAVDEIILQFE